MVVCKRGFGTTYRYRLRGSSCQKRIFLGSLTAWRAQISGQKYFILFYFILFFILFYFTLFCVCFILFCFVFVLFYFILFYFIFVFVLSYFILFCFCFCFILFYFILFLFYLILFYFILFLFYFILFCFCIILFYFILLYFVFVLSYFILFYFINAWLLPKSHAEMLFPKLFHLATPDIHSRVNKVCSNILAVVIVYRLTLAVNSSVTNKRVPNVYSFLIE